MKQADHNDKSFWLDTYGPYSPNPALHGSIDVDFAVVGGGFTGLATAYHLRRTEPGASVAVFESEIVGYGASGRNGGFSMTLFGFDPITTKAFFGLGRMLEAQRYMERAVDCVDALVKEHALQSDYWHPGFLRVATTPAHADRIRRCIDLFAGNGIEGIEWLDGPAVRSEVESPLFIGAWWEPRCGLLNPAKHVRELKRVAEQAGAVVYERTPVVQINCGRDLTLTTPSGIVKARRLALATNAYSHLLPELWLRQVPVFTHMVVTEPLTPQQLGSIGWGKRQGIEDARNLVHYFRLTADGRLAMGGSDVTLAYGRGMDHDRSDRIFADLRRDVGRIFPSLRNVRFTHSWGGPVSVTTQMVPALGYLGDRRVAYSVGCMGHGVSLTHLNGRTLADLLCERKTDLTDVWFVNRRVLPWPPEPLRFAVSQAILGLLKLEDRWRERDLR